MVAPNYAAARSELAKSMGLGQSGRKPAKRGRKTGGQVSRSRPRATADLRGRAQGGTEA